MNFETKRVPQIKFIIILNLFILSLPFFALLIPLFEKRYTDIYIGLAIHIPLCLIIILQFTLLRKYYFGKVFTNEKGAGYKYKGSVYKFFNWEEIIKVKINPSNLIFYKSKKINRGKNIIEINFDFSTKYYLESQQNYKQINKFIKQKQKLHSFDLTYASANIKQIYEEL